MAEEEGRFMRKMKEEPLIPLSMAVLVAACGIGAARLKSATKHQSLSVYLMQLRVAAQTAVVGVLSMGMVFNIYKNLQPKKDDA